LVREAVVERENALNFREIMDGRKIFLAKLSQGAIGEENAALLGSLLVSKFHQTAMTRQDVAEESRTPFFLFADEFQNVATPSMAGLFAGVRKYKLSLCVAHQDLYQLHSTAPELERSILANAYSRVLFRVSEEDARKVERGMGEYTAEIWSTSDAVKRYAAWGNATTRSASIPYPFQNCRSRRRSVGASMSEAKV
jgi:type IV secretory pathway TraG/TraD family ATPase VirD4